MYKQHSQIGCFNSPRVQQVDLAPLIVHLLHYAAVSVKTATPARLL